jgi:hypothetical protein
MATAIWFGVRRLPNTHRRRKQLKWHSSARWTSELKISARGSKPFYNLRVPAQPGGWGMGMIAHLETKAGAGEHRQLDILGAR